MKSLFDNHQYTSFVTRINKLTPQAIAQWGKMDVAQMFAHCKEAFKVPLSEKKLPRILIGYIFGPLIKAKLYNESPWKKNLPTSPNFKIKGQRDFEKEKHELLELITKFYALGPTGLSKHAHPFFGKITPEQWGRAMHKHLSHHLSQFGV